MIGFRMSLLKIAWLAPYQISLLKNDLNIISDLEADRTAPWLEHLSNELSKDKEIELHIITKSAKISKNQFVCKNNIGFHIIKHSIPLVHRGYPSWLPVDKCLLYSELRMKINKEISKIQPDLVHAHGTETSYGLIASLTHRPSLISIQGIIELIRKVENRKDLQVLIERYAIKRNKYFGCRTEWDKSHVMKINSKAVIYYMPEAIDPIFFRNEWRDDVKNYITYVGGIHERKGIGVLVNAFNNIAKKIPDARLIIIGIGDNSLKLKLQKYSIECNLSDRIEWKGSCSHSQILNELLKSKIFVLPSFIDNSPNSLCEALSLGVPSIASNIGGIPSIISNGKNGILVQPGNMNDLEDKIYDLIYDAQKRQFLSKNSRKLAIERYQPEVVAKIYKKIYNRIINSESA